MKRPVQVGSPQLVRTARLLRRHGKSVAQISAELGFSPYTIYNWTKGMGVSRTVPERFAHFERPALVKDTRTVTGILCGDPLPGRSALDRRTA